MTVFDEAVSMLARGRIDDAAAAFRRIDRSLKSMLAQDPNDPSTIRALALTANGLGTALFAAEKFEEAAAAFHDAFRYDPTFADAARNGSIALMSAERPEEAEQLALAAVALEPHGAASLTQLSVVLRELGRSAEALAYAEKALEEDPAFADAHFHLGFAAQELGDLARSEAAFARAIELQPGVPRYHYAWASGRKVRASDAAVIAHIEAAAAGRLSPTDRAESSFALAKCYEDLGRYEEAFEKLLEGNAAKRATFLDYDGGEIAQMEQLASVFSGDRMAALRGLGHPSAAPVFIIGMPRSGTTLIEQILSAHPSVRALGERIDFRLVVSGHARSLGLSFLPAVARFTAGDLQAMGAEYLRRVDANGAERITDKLPTNFLYAGAIALVFPHAKIVHARRDPVDTCISCFSQLFHYGNAHTYDLTELGRHYRAYERLMEHWRAVLPPGMMLEVQYEEVVADLETQARRIVAHLGITWDERCLAFYRAERTVKTASVTQVRKPIYGSSIGRAARYGEKLRPLLDALDGRI